MLLILSPLLLPILLAALVRTAPHARSLETERRTFITSPVYDTELPFMKDYSEYQISDGRGGTAEEEAAAVFVKPFEGADLASVPFEVFDSLKLAKEVVEDAEIELFEPAIAEESEDSAIGRALKVGMAKNRVLFATATVEILEIEAAHNKAMSVVDPYGESDLEYAREYLAWTIEADRENDGEPSFGVT